MKKKFLLLNLYLLLFIFLFTRRNDFANGDGAEWESWLNRFD